MKLGLGTVQFGLRYGISNKSGQVAVGEVEKILKLASSSGINILDTAAGYGDSERLLGACLNSVSNFSIVTKSIPLKKGDVKSEDVVKVEAAFQDSLRKMGQSSVYGLLVHQSSDLLCPGGDYLYSTLRRLKDDGLVKKIGVSVYGKDEVDRLFDRYSFDLVQLPVNVFDQRLVHDGTLQWLHAAGIEIHVRSALLQGLLVMPSAELPRYFDTIRLHHQDYLAALSRAGLSPVSGALGLFHQLKEVTTVLVGVETSIHLGECLDAVQDTPDLDFSSFAIHDPLMIDPRFWC